MGYRTKDEPLESSPSDACVLFRPMHLGNVFSMCHYMFRVFKFIVYLRYTVTHFVFFLFFFFSVTFSPEALRRPPIALSLSLSSHSAAVSASPRFEYLCIPPTSYLSYESGVRSTEYRSPPSITL
ncbi:hypothetical protein SODALDRAFT_151169 [Sodiomyces alkalinus F11]|uniref:Transmembrane protein n=1 Tax=Sodiomyces alkalinus (strain CBS 110278 / VKM F-3762 / F11) TaxID=1314773 RepID=A0A3N2PWZ3_SODAK|nr:hypothetical protein SODALDRAFT_151169 [Sodiomyces alkalinus F11]ROT39040.1 hypothetical protein SODALDRAFT_151169 [Sodiomyces alkalinus F11]